MIDRDDRRPLAEPRPDPTGEVAEPRPGAPEHVSPGGQAPAGKDARRDRGFVPDLEGHGQELWIPGH